MTKNGKPIMGGNGGGYNKKPKLPVWRVTQSRNGHSRPQIAGKTHNAPKARNPGGRTCLVYVLALALIPAVSVILGVRWMT